MSPCLCAPWWVHVLVGGAHGLYVCMKYASVHSRFDCECVETPCHTQSARQEDNDARPSPLWSGRVRPMDTAAGTHCPFLFPRQMGGDSLSFVNPAGAARRPVLALHPKWCPTISLRLTLHYASRDPNEVTRGDGGRDEDRADRCGEEARKQMDGNRRSHGERE